MRLWPGVSLMLFLFLVVSNIWWLYHALDQATILKYRGAELYDCTKSLTSYRAVIPGLAAGKSKSEIIELIQNELQETAFEKEGDTVIGRVVLEFDENDLLVKVY